MPYARRPDGPVLAGDTVADGVIGGFAYVPTRHPDAANDRLLLVGEQGLAEPPARPVPATATEHAEAPPARLPGHSFRKATELDANLPGQVMRLLSLRGAPWEAVAPALLEHLHQNGELVWITGGAARDLISGGACAEVNDLDLSGTAPPGRFTQHARTVRRRLGAEYRLKVSKDSLVCSAAPSRGGNRLFEYRALNLPGYRFPASGSDMAEDARGRDFTINSLYYDPKRHVVLDPTERGLDDLAATPRRLVSINTEAAARAHIALRALKFVLRWENTFGTETAGLRDFFAALPGGWLENLDETAWQRVLTWHARCVGDASTQRQLDAAQRLGPAVAGLVRELLQRRTAA